MYDGSDTKMYLEEIGWGIIYIDENAFCGHLKYIEHQPFQDIRYTIINDKALSFKSSVSEFYQTKYIEALYYILFLRCPNFPWQNGTFSGYICQIYPIFTKIVADGSRDGGFVKIWYFPWKCTNWMSTFSRYKIYNMHFSMIKPDLSKVQFQKFIRQSIIESLCYISFWKHFCL